MAGKTGTAQKVEPLGHGYSDKRIASFIGMVPAEAPRLVIAVVVDEPKTDVYGGLVAAPAFKKIAEAAMPYLGVPPSLNVPWGAVPARIAAAHPAAVHPASPSAAPSAGAQAEAEGEVEAEAQSEVVPEEVGSSTDVQVPDVKGHAGRDAVSRLLAAALAPRVVGSGQVIAQEPAAGVRVARGAQVTVELAAKR